MDLQTLDPLRNPVEPTQSKLASEVEASLESADKAAKFLAERPHLMIQDGVFLMMSPDGNPSVFYHDTMYSQTQLSINGQEPCRTKQYYDRNTNTWHFEYLIPISGPRREFLKVARENLLTLVKKSYFYNVPLIYYDRLKTDFTT